jgi:hypothetical protein
MERKPTKQEIINFHGYNKPKRVKLPAIVECRLVDIFGNIVKRGSYALCEYQKKILGGNLTIKVIRKGDKEQVIIKNSPFKN